MSLFDLKIVGGETFELTLEEAEMVRLAIESGSKSITLQRLSAWLNTSTIMSITPSKKDDPNYRRYMIDKNNYGYKGSFETWKDEAGVNRRLNDSNGKTPAIEGKENKQLVSISDVIKDRI